MANFNNFGSDFLTAFGSALNPQAAQLIAQQNQIREDRALRDQQKNNVQQQLRNLIGTAPSQGFQNPEQQTPQFTGNVAQTGSPGTGLGANMSQDQVTNLQNLAAASPETALKQLAGQMSPSGKEGFTLSPGQTRFDAQGNKVAGGGDTPIDTSKQFNQIIKIRDRFTKNTDEFAKQDNAFARIRASAQDPTAAGDLALLFNYMKLLDPGSTVREGEFATAKNAGGVDDTTRAFFGKIMNGTRLSPDQRADFLNRSEKLYTAAVNSNEKRRNESNKLAKARGLPEDQATYERSTQIDERRTTKVKGKTVRAYRIGNKWYTY